MTTDVENKDGAADPEKNRERESLRRKAKEKSETKEREIRARDPHFQSAQKALPEIVAAMENAMGCSIPERYHETIFEKLNGYFKTRQEWESLESRKKLRASLTKMRKAAATLHKGLHVMTDEQVKRIGLAQLLYEFAIEKERTDEMIEHPGLWVHDTKMFLLRMEDCFKKGLKELDRKGPVKESASRDLTFWLAQLWFAVTKKAPSVWNGKNASSPFVVFVKETFTVLDGKHFTETNSRDKARTADEWRIESSEEADAWLKEKGFLT
jgi:hypothetical protein